MWAGERQRWFVYATFGHSATSLDSSVTPGDDERDNLLNVVPHAEFAGNALYEYLPDLSRGYVRLRPRPTLAAVLADASAQALPNGVTHLIARMTVEILTLRPTMSLGVGSPPRE